MWKILNICLLVFFWGLTNSAFSQSDSTVFPAQKSISPSLLTPFHPDSAGNGRPSLQKKSSNSLADSLAEAQPDSLTLSDTLSDDFEPSADTLPFIGNSPSALTRSSTIRPRTPFLSMSTSAKPNSIPKALYNTTVWS